MKVKGNAEGTHLGVEKADVLPPEDFGHEVTPRTEYVGHDR